LSYHSKGLEGGKQGVYFDGKLIVYLGKLGNIGDWQSVE
jgi:hypothetical protein